MRPQGHVITSAGLGAVFWAASRDPSTMLLSLAFGVLIDLDHFIDYWYSEGRICFDLPTFMATRYWERSGRIFVLFHAWEYLPFVYLLWQALKGRKWAIAATAAMSSHVLADHLVNDLRPLGYFIVYRLAHRFRVDDLMDWDRLRELDELRTERHRLAKEGRLPWHSRLVALFV